MATLRENLVTRLEAIGVELAAIDATKVGGIANLAHSSGGTSVDHYKYKMSLYEEMAAIQKQLLEMDQLEAAMDGTDGPAEEITRGYV
jgi:hypothetical protein